MNHLKEYEYYFDGPWGYDDDTGAPEDPYGQPFKAFGTDPEVRAVTRRIVACVNACAGMSTEEIEAFGLGELAECARNWLAGDNG